MSTLNDNLKRMDGIPHLEIDITNENLKEGIAEIVRELRPEWDIEQVKTENKSAGYLNTNYLLHIPTREDGVFVRLISSKMEEIVDGTVRAMIYMRRHNLGAKLLCTFNNGIVMENVIGDTVTWNNFRIVKESHIWRQIAQEMAKWHQATNMKDIKELGINTHDQVWTTLKQQVKGILSSGKLPPTIMEGLPSIEEIDKLWKDVMDRFAKYKCELCFCHMDPNPTNNVITKDRGVVKVDYDLCYLDFPQMEMSVSFTTIIDLANPSFDDVPTIDEQKVFIREYLEERRRIDPSRAAVTDRDVEYWLFLERNARLAQCLKGILITLLVQHAGTRNFDMAIGQLCWKSYQEQAVSVLAEEFDLE